jgi:hypothetical protein
MIGNAANFIDMEKLRDLVERRLCELGTLEPKQFPLTQRIVIRGGKPCGWYFCVHGPRSVKLTAIADLTSRSVILYGSDGVRSDSIPIPSRYTSTHRN